MKRFRDLKESDVTSESRYLKRREFVVGLGASALCIGCGTPPPIDGRQGLLANRAERDPIAFGTCQEETAFKVAPRHPDFSAVPQRAVTPLLTAATYNNFYEFSVSKKDVWKRVRDFKTRPFQIEVTGLVRNPRIYDVDDLIRAFDAEERIYRFRCVEAWSMVVPWTGIPFRSLIEAVEPTADANYVRFWTYRDDANMLGIRNSPHYPWPYFEALRVDEAANRLTMLATGMYGRPLLKQNGAPVRLIVPWKYGYKSIKSVCKIEFVKERPATFWNSFAPGEYSFESNVDPESPHPRWSQATERDIETNDRIATQKYNGYSAWVSSLYKKGT